ncbi:MAG: hypothetical protein AAB645_02120 [Patescibacteria group bacterium]
MKKNILIIIISVLILGIGAWLYWAVTNTPSPSSGPSVLENIRNLFPIGRGNNANVGPIGTDAGMPAGESLINSPIPGQSNLSNYGVLTQISNNPIGGADIVTLNGTSTPVFIDRASGNIYKVDSANLAISHLTNSSLPTVYQSYWGWDKNSVKVLAYHGLDNGLELFAGAFKSNFITSTSSIDKPIELTGQPLNLSILDLAVSPRHDKVFYLTKGADGVLGFVSDWDLKNQKLVFRSPFSEWLASWPEDNIVVLQTKPALGIIGYLYYLNLKTGVLTKMLEGDDLSALVSPDLKKVIYTVGKGASLNLLQIGNPSQDTPLGINTYPEKCVWTKDAKKIYCAAPVSLPKDVSIENWYRGEVSFTDNLWVVDAVYGSLKQTLNLTVKGGEGLDGVNLFLNKNGDYLFLTNKTDNTLWMADLKDAFPVPSSSILPGKQATTSVATSSPIATTTLKVGR